MTADTGDAAVVQDAEAGLGRSVESLAEKLFAAAANRPRLGALWIVREGEDQTAEARVRLPDAGLPLVLAALVLPLGGGAGRSDDDVGFLLRRHRFRLRSDICGRAGFGYAGPRPGRCRLQCALEEGHRLGRSVVRRSRAGGKVDTARAATPGVPQPHLVRGRGGIIAHAGHTLSIDPLVVRPKVLVVGVSLWFRNTKPLWAVRDHGRLCRPSSTPVGDGYLDEYRFRRLHHTNPNSSMSSPVRSEPSPVSSRPLEQTRISPFWMRSFSV